MHGCVTTTFQCQPQPAEKKSTIEFSGRKLTEKEKLMESGSRQEQVVGPTSFQRRKKPIIGSLYTGKKTDVALNLSKKKDHVQERSFWGVLRQTYNNLSKSIYHQNVGGGVAVQATGRTSLWCRFTG